MLTRGNVKSLFAWLCEHKFYKPNSSWVQITKGSVWQVDTSSKLTWLVLASIQEFATCEWSRSFGRKQLDNDLDIGSGTTQDYPQFLEDPKNPSDFHLISASISNPIRSDPSPRNRTRRMARVEEINPITERRSPVRRYRSYQEHCLGMAMAWHQRSNEWIGDQHCLRALNHFGMKIFGGSSWGKMMQDSICPDQIIVPLQLLVPAGVGYLPRDATWLVR